MKTFNAQLSTFNFQGSCFRCVFVESGTLNIPLFPSGSAFNTPMSYSSDPSGTLVPIVLIAALAIGAISSLLWSYSRSEALIRSWAIENGCTMISLERRLFLKGPFFLLTSKGQTVYYVTVQDATGAMRHVWVRCGGYFLGVYSDKVEARWDD